MARSAVLRTVRFWWNRFGPSFAAEIRRRRAETLRAVPQWRWHLDEVFVKINGETQYLWRAVDHEGEVLEVFATKRRDRRAALAFLKRRMKRYGRPQAIVTDAYAVSRRQRKKAEMLFAHLNRILSLGRLTLRGPTGAHDEFFLAATAQNLRKLAKKILTQDPAAVTA